MRLPQRQCGWDAPRGLRWCRADGLLARRGGGGGRGGGESLRAAHPDPQPHPSSPAHMQRRERAGPSAVGPLITRARATVATTAQDGRDRQATTRLWLRAGRRTPPPMQLQRWPPTQPAEPHSVPSSSALAWMRLPHGASARGGREEQHAPPQSQRRRTAGEGEEVAVWRGVTPRWLCVRPPRPPHTHTHPASTMA